jgi:Mg2+/Co2+ transporter CorB
MKAISNALISILTTIIMLPVCTIIFVVSLVWFVFAEVLKKTTKQKQPEQNKIQLSCCGNKMTGLFKDVNRCPTCKELQ